MRKHTFTTGEYYHVYNRGVDKRNIFTDGHDLERFIETVNVLNTIDSLGGLKEYKYLKNNTFRHPMSETSPLVKIISFCILDNHFHFVLRQEADGGISKFMQKLGNGYTKYFNARQDRSGSLFQGGFKSKYIHNNEYLLNIFAYVSLNYMVHTKSRHRMSGLMVGCEKHIFDVNSSPIKNFDPSIVLGQFKSKTSLMDFMSGTVEYIFENREKGSGMK
jgi:putative transposase